MEWTNVVVEKKNLREYGRRGKVGKEKRREREKRVRH